MAYLHFGTGDEPRLTVEVEHLSAPMAHHERGLSWTATGYGQRIPTTLMVRWNGRLRRVYSCQFSNAGTAYIGKSWAKREATVSL